MVRDNHKYRSVNLKNVPEFLFYERLLETVVLCILRTDPVLKYQTLGLT